MMLVLEVVTTALLLLAGATTAQKPINLDRSPVNTSQESGSLAIPRQPTAAVINSSSLPNESKPLKTESKESLNSNEDLTSDLNILPSAEIRPGIKQTYRKKRKVIFGGGSYGHSGRRTSAAVGGDPYGRRRDPHGPQNRPHEAWQYQQRREDASSSYSSMKVRRITNVHATTTTRRPDYVIVTRMVTPASYNSPSRSSQITGARLMTSAPYNKHSRSSLITGIAENEKKEDFPSDDRKRQKNGQKVPKRKLTKELKWEIAKFALENSPQEAADRYGSMFSRRLSAKKIEKFVKRFQRQQKRGKGSHQ